MLARVEPAVIHELVLELSEPAPLPDWFLSWLTRWWTTEQAAPWAQQCEHKACRVLRAASLRQ